MVIFFWIALLIFVMSLALCICAEEKYTRPMQIVIFGLFLGASGIAFAMFGPGGLLWSIGTW